MKKDPQLAEKFATAVLEELALLRAEVVSQRAVLIELLSLTTKQRRRKIKDRLYDRRLDAAFRIGQSLVKRVGLKNAGLILRPSNHTDKSED